MKKFSKLCVVLLLLVALDTRAANQSAFEEFGSCIDKSAPMGLLRELGRYSDRAIDVNELLDETIKRSNALKNKEVSGCANTLFKAFSTEPDHPLKSAKMRYANALYKSLRSRELEEIDDKGTAHAMVIADHEILQEIRAFTDYLLKQEQVAAQRKQQLDAQRAKEEAYIRGMEAIERKYQAENNALIEQYIQRLNAERSRQSWMDAARIINEVTKPVIPPSLRCEPDPMAIVPGTLRCR